METRYNHLNEYLKNKFGERTLKICVDGGFTCPNRDGKCGTGGCTFCGEKGSGEHLKNLSIQNQIYSFLDSYRGERANSFIIYFQNFTNTYDTVENLRKKYDEALNINLSKYNNKKIVGLQIATRPDCINNDIIELLKEYNKRIYVCVELGLQTSNDIIAKNFNRGYNSDTFTKAAKLLNENNIDVITHMMIGLPGETEQDLIDTINFINKHNIQGLKIHSTYIIEGTKLNEMYKNNEYTPMTYDYYMKWLTYTITHINPNIIIHRISGDAPKDLLVAPEWNLHKKKIMNGLDKILREQDLYQGMFYNK